jgi:lipopolysaccharide transport system ATP-binding protein
VDFAGVGKYIDTPVKRYSSGMYVRLAFAVAAHLEPEILIVDEVLAVGDAEFQKKAIGKMQNINRYYGRTVLFVSHNMAAVTNLCRNGILLKNGRIRIHDTIEKVIHEYQVSYEEDIKSNDIESNNNRSGNGKVILSNLYFTNKSDQEVNSIFTGDDVSLNFILKVNDSGIRNVDIGFSIHNFIGDRLAVVYSSYFNKRFNYNERKYYKVSFNIKKVFFQPGKYSIGTRITENGNEADWIKDKVLSFDVVMGDFYNTGNKGITENTQFLLDGIWE